MGADRMRFSTSASVTGVKEVMTDVIAVAAGMEIVGVEPHNFDLILSATLRTLSVKKTLKSWASLLVSWS